MIAPRANPQLRGQSAATATLHHAATAGRLHHGWLITGQPGIGKATLAFRFARWLLAGADSPDLSLPESHPVFRRVAAGTHPDLFTLERLLHEKTGKLQSEIVIDTVRETTKKMHRTAYEGGWRVAIIDGAENMNPQTANALLKLLEEPPPRAILLLVSAAPGRLLPTIRSRCRTLALAPLAEPDVLALLADYAPELEPTACARLAGLAEGSIGTALGLVAGGVSLAGLVDEALASPVAPQRAQSIAEEVTRQVDGTDEFERFFALLRAGLAARTRSMARAGQPPPRLAEAVRLWQELGKLELETIGLNLDKRAALIVALSQLHGS